SIFIVDMLYIIFDKNNHTARGKSFSFLSNIHTELDEQQLLVLESRLSRFIKDMRVEYVISDLADDAIKLMVSKIVGFADINRLRSYYPNYKNIVFLESVINNLQDELIENYKITSSLLPALDMLVGKDTIPVMTIHKSKGLEYQSVIFIGLEDGAFWSFQKQPDEDKCSFFVALSRAKERVIFTFSHQREGKYGMTQQSIKNISVIIEQLQNSRVVSIVEKT
ncbi:ATP-dependent helicase, partial [Kaistia algarum]